MCDTIKQKNLPDEKKPQYVYKRVQKVGEGKYISPVMGESIKKDVWKKAPKRPEIAKASPMSDLVYLIRRPYKKSQYISSSSFYPHHDGMWGSFKTEREAKTADLCSNFVKGGKKPTKFPVVVVKCEVKGTVHSATHSFQDTYLTEYIKIVEEVGPPAY